MANARRRTQRTSRTATRMAARSGGAAAVSDVESSPISMVDWQKEMHYINKDLRELLIITVLLFVLLFAVGFFL